MAGWYFRADTRLFEKMRCGDEEINTLSTGNCVLQFLDQTRSRQAFGLSTVVMCRCR